MDIVQTNQVVYDLKSGVKLFITPLSILGNSHFTKRSIEMYPDPDPTPYEAPLKDALVEGDKRSAMSDPAYVALLQPVQTRRAFAYQNLLLAAAVDTPEREHVLSKYAHLITSTRGAVVPLPGGITQTIEDDFVRLLYLSLATPEEIKTVVSHIVRLLPLEPGEVIDGLKFFRGVELQRHIAS